jgi:hypothetical protein
MTEQDKRERRNVVIFLTDKALADAPAALSSDQPKWRQVLWGILHPFKFGHAHGRLMALYEAALAITKGEHQPKGPEKHGRTDRP